MDQDHNPQNEQPRDILIPKEKVRKISSDKVEILGEESAHSSAEARRNPFEGTPFAFKNVKVLTGGPLVFLLPILLPLFLLLMLVMIVPLMLFGRFFIRRAR